MALDVGGGLEGCPCLPSLCLTLQKEPTRVVVSVCPPLAFSLGRAQGLSVCPPLAFPLGRAQGLSLSWSSPGVVTAFPSLSPPFGKGQGIDTSFWRQSEGSHRLPSPGPSFWEGPRGCPGLWEEPEDRQCWPSTSLSLRKQPGDGCRSPPCSPLWDRPGGCHI